MPETPHRRGQDHDGLLHRPAITPALTAEEWRRLRNPPPQCVSIEQAYPSDLASMADDSRHALAALALYGEPFGFTRQDLRDLRNAADHHEWVDGVESVRLHTLADRIEALLPPA